MKCEFQKPEESGPWGELRRFEAGVSIFRRGVEGPDPEDVLEV